MIMSLFAAGGLWTWWIVGMILIAIEVFAPISVFLWLGLAAFAVGGLTFIFGMDSSFWGWQQQVLVFAVLALVFVFIGRKLMTQKGWDKSDAPGLNERGSNLVGTVAVLSEAISEGKGRAKIGDGTWRVTGPDLPVGKRVKVIAQDGGTLIVEAD